MREILREKGVAVLEARMEKEGMMLYITCPHCEWVTVRTPYYVSSLTHQKCPNCKGNYTVMDVKNRAKMPSKDSAS